VDQTTRIFKALASEDRLSVVLLLLSRDASEKEIVMALEIPQQSATRHLTALADAGLVRRERPRSRYALTDLEAIRGLLEAASALGASVAHSRLQREQSFGRAIRKTRFRETDSQANGSS
jgi:DNA-binding transcriptional ArsR family regulator